MKNSGAAVKLRQKKLLEHLQTLKTDRVSELAERFGVTPATMRRDLELLEEQGFIRRSFGSASYILPSNDDVQYTTPRGNPTPSRYAIAKLAAGMVQDGDVIFFNSSSTALYIQDYLPDINVTIITNNGRALYAKRKRGVTLLLTGGEVYGQKQSLVGEFALSALSQTTASKCFLGVSGISASGGITSSILQETAVNRQMLHRCTGPKIVVADGSKIGAKRSFFSGGLDEITCLITDASADETELQRIRDLGVEVILAEL